MSATLLGSLLVSLGLDSGEFKSGLSQAEKELRASQKRFERIGKGMSDFGNKLSLSVTTPIIAGFAALTKHLTSSASEITRTAQLANASVEEFQRAAFAAKSVGIESEKLGDIYKDVNDRVGEFIQTGGGEMKDFFEKIAPRVGVTAEMFKKLSGPQALQLYFNSLEKAGLNQQELTFYMEAMADEASGLIPLLRENGREMAALGEKAAVLTPKDIEGLKDFKQAIADLGQAITAVGIALAQAGVFETMTNFINAVSTFIRQIAEANPELVKFGATMALVAAAIGPVLIAIGLATTAIAPLLAGFKVVGTIAMSTGTVLGSLTVAFTALRAAVFALGASVAPLLGPLAAIAAVGLLIYANWDKIAPALKEFWEIAKAALGPPLRDLVNAVTDLFTELWTGPLGQGVRAAIGALIDFNRAVGDALGPVFLAVLRGAIAALAEFFRQIGQGVRLVTALLSGEWRSAWKIASGDASSALDVIRTNILRLLGPIGMVIEGLQRMKGLSPSPAGGAQGVSLQDSLAKMLSTVIGGATDDVRKALSKPSAGPAIKTGGASGGGGPSAADIAQKAAQTAARFQDDLGQLRIDLLQAENEYSANVRQRRDVAMAALDEELASFERNLALDKDTTAARKEQLLAAKRALIDQQKANAEQEFGRDIAEQASQLQQAALRLQIDDAALRSQIADNSRDRLAAELALFDLNERLRVAELDRVLAVEATASAAWQNAKAEQDALAASRLDRRNAVGLANATPAQRFAQSLRLSAGQMADAIDQIKIDGLNTLNDGLVDAMVNFRSLGDVARSVLRQILGDLLSLQIRKSIIGPLAGMLGMGLGGGGGLNLGSLASSANSVIDAGIAGFSIPGFAKGTRFAPGGLALVGERGPELVNLRRGSQVIPNSDLKGFGGRGESHNPTFIFPGITNAKEAREAGGQAARRYRRELSPMRNVV